MSEFEHGMEHGDPHISPPADEVSDLNKKRAQLAEHWDQLHTTLQDPINEHDASLRDQLNDTSDQINEIDIRLQELAERMHADVPQTPDTSSPDSFFHTESDSEHTPGPPPLPTFDDEDTAVNPAEVRNLPLDTQHEDSPAEPPLIISPERELPTPPELPEFPTLRAPEASQDVEVPQVLEVPQAPEVPESLAEPRESDEARQARIEREKEMEDSIRARFTQAVEAKIARKDHSITPERQQFVREITQQFLDDMYAAHALTDPETPQRITKMNQATQDALKGFELDDAHGFRGASDHVYEGRILSGFLSYVGTPSGGIGWFTRAEGREHGEGTLLNRLHDAQGAIAFLKTLNIELAYMKGMSPPNMKQVTGSFDPDCYERITRSLHDEQLPLKPTASGAYIADESQIAQMWQQARNEARGFYGSVTRRPEVPDNEAIEDAFAENLERVQQIDMAVSERTRITREAEQRAHAKELETVTAKIAELEKHSAVHATETPETINKQIEANNWAIEAQNAIITANEQALQTQSLWDKWTQSGRLKNEIATAKFTLQRLTAAQDGLKVKLAQANHRAEMLDAESLDDLRARKQQLEAATGSPRF